jgi:anti-sigma-K factor RskA
MPANPLSDDIAGLMRVLEEFERSIGERRMSTDRQTAKLHDEAQAKMAAFANTVNRSENRLVERIATAMSKNFEFKPV